MTRLATITHWLDPIRWFRWATGPIFTKELRVSSRLRRNYWLRFGYLALLTIFVALFWFSEFSRSSYGGPAYRIYRMSETGKGIIAMVAWFQFICLQLIAIVMLSTSISEEITKRTLGVLMCTPIKSFQIVIGKLLSKLLQLLLLLAISVPLMIVVRVFGGVPWEFVVASTCVTLTTALLAGSMSMLFSILSRRSYVVILGGILVMVVVFLALPFLLIVGLKLDERLITGGWLGYLDPYFVMAALTESLMSPGRGGFFQLTWPLHCAAMLGLASLILAVCAVRVRKVALRQATGDPGTSRWRRRKSAAVADAENRDESRIRRVRGSAIIWKELRTGSTRSRWRRIVEPALVLLILFGTYISLAVHHNLGDRETHMAYAVVLVMVGIVVTAVMSATNITTEKEAGTWPLLLSTTLTPEQIIFGKAVGALRRCLPIWGLLALHLTIFTLAGFIHPMAGVHLAMIVTGVVVLLTGTGLFFGTLFRKTTAAVVVNLMLAITLWGLLAMLLFFVGEIVSRNEQVGEIYACANPVAQTVVATEAAAGKERARKKLEELRYNWPRPMGGESRVVGTTLGIFGTMLGYSAVGVFFATLAGARLRKKIV